MNLATSATAPASRPRLGALFRARLSRSSALDGSIAGFAGGSSPLRNNGFLIAKPFRVQQQLTGCGFSKIDFSNRQNSVIRRACPSASFFGLQHLGSSFQNAGLPGALCATEWPNLPGTVNRVETHSSRRKQTIGQPSTRNFAITGSASIVTRGLAQTGPRDFRRKNSLRFGRAIRTMDSRFSLTMSDRSKPISRGVYRFAVLTTSFTILLLMAGALVTNNDAGDSIPSWPLAGPDALIPAHFVGGIRFEYSHRVIAGIVSLLTLALAVWITKVDKRRLARGLGWTAVALVLAQAALGGIRVLGNDPSITATEHATLAQIFLITLVGLTVYLSPWWQGDLPQFEDRGSPRATALASATTGVILAQVLLGAAYRHGLANIVPHLVGAAVVTVMVVWVARVVKRRFRESHTLRKSVVLLHSFFGVQILLGFAAWWAMNRPINIVQPTDVFVTLTVAHVLGGALLLASSTLLMLVCFRLTTPAHAAAGSPVAPPRAVSAAGGSPERARG
jgi:heme A synthase